MASAKQKKAQNAKKQNQTNQQKSPLEKQKPNTILCEAQVIEVLPNATFKVMLKEFNIPIIATLSGKVRINYIKILTGDLVSVELSTYDLTKGRIVYRHKNNSFATKSTQKK